MVWVRMIGYAFVNNFLGGDLFELFALAVVHALYFFALLSFG